MLITNHDAVIVSHVFPSLVYGQKCNTVNNMYLVLKLVFKIYAFNSSRP